MLRLNRKQRTAISETLRQVGNLTLGVLALGQLVSGRPVLWSFLTLGVAPWSLFLVYAMILLRGEE